MAKRVVAILAACACALCLAACAKEISGNCESVVEQCQQVATNENVEVTVTGYLAPGQSASNDMFMICDGELDYVVYISLANKADAGKVVGRTSFKGKLSAGMVLEHSVYVKEAAVV